MAGESASLAKLILLLGLVFFIISALYPGAGASWDGFKQQISGQNFPVFDNPFSNRTYKSSLTAAAAFCYATDGGLCNGQTTPAPTGCTFAQGYVCLQNPSKGDAAYITLVGDDGANNNNFAVNISQDTFPDYSIQTVDFSVWCRSPSASAIAFKIRAVVPPQVPLTLSATCPASQYYTKVSTSYTHQIVSSPYGSNVTFTVFRDGTQTGAIAFFTGIQVDVYFVPEQVTCTGNVFENTGCQISNFGRTVLKIGQAIVNAGIFIVSVFVFGFQLIWSIFVGVFGSILFLVKLPDAPTEVQAIVAAPAICVLAWIGFVIAKIARGTGSVSG